MRTVPAGAIAGFQPGGMDPSVAERRIWAELSGVETRSDWVGDGVAGTRKGELSAGRGVFSLCVLPVRRCASANNLWSSPKAA